MSNVLANTVLLVYCFIHYIIIIIHRTVCFSFSSTTVLLRNFFFWQNMTRGKREPSTFMGEIWGLGRDRRHFDGSLSILVPV